MRLIYQLIGLTLVIGVVPLATAGYALIDINKEELQASVQEGHTDRAKHQEEVVSSFLGRARSELAASTYDRDLVGMEPAALERYVEFLLGQYPELLALAVLEGEGRVVAVGVRQGEDGPSPEELARFLEAVPAREVLAGGGERLGEVQACPRLERLLLPYARPLGEGAVLAAALDLAPLMGALGSAGFRRRGYAALLDAEGRLLAHPDQERAMAREPLPWADEGLRRQLREERIPGTTGVTGPGGERLLVGYARVRDPLVDWGVLVVEPEDDAYHAARKMAWVTLALGVATVLAAVAAGLLLAARIVRPVYRLVEATREFAVGNLRHRLPEGGGGEMAVLAGSFNRMGGALLARDREVEAIHETARELGSMLELEPLAARALRSVHEVLRVRRLAFGVLEGGVLRVVAALGWPEGEEPGDEPLSQGEGVVGFVAGRTRSVLLNAPSPAGYRAAEGLEEPVPAEGGQGRMEVLFEDARRILCVPFVYEGCVLGVLACHEREDGLPFGRTDREFAEIIAGACAVAVENIRLLGEMIEKTRMQAELRTAEAVQRTLLPRSHPSTRVMDLAGHFAAATEVGGDWYGYLMDPRRERLAVLIGDVTGHGVPSALIAAAADSFVRTLGELQDLVQTAGTPPRDLLSPASLLERLNRVIAELADRRLCMTFFASTLDLHTGALRYANAGHCFPVLLRAQGGEVEFLRARGVRLGEGPEAHYREQEVSLAPGDVVVWYSDGVPERPGPDGEPFGKRRLVEAVRRRAREGALPILEGLVGEAAAHARGAPPQDDVTVVVGKVREMPERRALVVGDVGGLLGAGRLYLDGLALRSEEVEAREVPRLLDTGAFHAVIADREEVLGEAARAASASLRVLVAQGSLAGHLDALRAASSTHATFLPSSLALQDLRATLQACLGPVRGWWGPWLPGGERLHEAEIRGSRERAGAVQGLDEFLLAAGVDEFLRSQVQTVADELITNAVFNAPVDPAGAPRHAHLDRREAVHLEPGEAARLRCAVAPGRILVDVRDPFGSLRPETVLDYLGRTLSRGKAELEEKAGGAGLGLHRVYQAASVLAIDVEPGASTEVLAVLDASLSLRDYRRQPTAFHLRHGGLA
ncbi:MAG: SpoIIE family protein phosphatase [Planctomycetes bacterium]|nr:SpoIIE family protein phosphatase [Planctomycetota bacterium]